MLPEQRRYVAKQILIYMPIDLFPCRDGLLTKILPFDADPGRSLMGQGLERALDASSAQVTDDNPSIHEVRPRRASARIDVSNINDARRRFFLGFGRHIQIL
jgi:hypothetical protein